MQTLVPALLAHASSLPHVHPGDVVIIIVGMTLLALGLIVSQNWRKR